MGDQLIEIGLPLAKQLIPKEKMAEIAKAVLNKLTVEEIKEFLPKTLDEAFTLMEKLVPGIGQLKGPISSLTSKIGPSTPVFDIKAQLGESKLVANVVAVLGKKQ